MKKFLLYAVLFAVHFAVSFVCNWILSESANIIQTLISSVVFVLIYPVVLHFLKKEKERANLAANCRLAKFPFDESL